MQMVCPIMICKENKCAQCGEKSFPLYCDKYAYESDGIVIFNKVKTAHGFPRTA